ncbi:MAG TPA: hypothetical protein VK595_16965 [Vicinamibacterales bacterium]|nr:hypothetical protein [Vicinamibacterales bacterium]
MAINALALNLGVLAGARDAARLGADRRREIIEAHAGAVLMLEALATFADETRTEALL